MSNRSLKKISSAQAECVCTFPRHVAKIFGNASNMCGRCVRHASGIFGVCLGRVGDFRNCLGHSWDEQIKTKYIASMLLFVICSKLCYKLKCVCLPDIPQDNWHANKHNVGPQVAPLQYKKRYHCRQEGSRSVEGSARPPEKRNKACNWNNRNENRRNQHRTKPAASCTVVERSQVLCSK